MHPHCKASFSLKKEFLGPELHCTHIIQPSTAVGGPRELSISRSACLEQKCRVKDVLDLPKTWV